jgi:hypothetical protein
MACRQVGPQVVSSGCGSIRTGRVSVMGNMVISPRR